MSCLLFTLLLPCLSSSQPQKHTLKFVLPTNVFSFLSFFTSSSKTHGLFSPAYECHFIFTFFHFCLLVCLHLSLLPSAPRLKTIGLFPRVHQSVTALHTRKCNQRGRLGKEARTFSGREGSVGIQSDRWTKEHRADKRTRTFHLKPTGECVWTGTRRRGNKLGHAMHRYILFPLPSLSPVAYMLISKLWR